MDDLDAKLTQERTHRANLAPRVLALAVIWLALLLLIADGLDAREHGARAKGTTVDNAPAPAKTPGPARQPRKWLPCAAINAAIATGKTPEMVADELEVTQDRASRCDECRSAGTADSEMAVLRSPGDVDGDGKSDRVTLEFKDCDYVVVAQLTRVGVRRSLVGEEITYPYPRFLGVVDINRDGKGEVFVQTDRGASTMVATLFTLVNDQLHQVTLDGAPVGLGAGRISHALRQHRMRNRKTRNDERSYVVWGLARRTSATRENAAVYVLDGSRLRLLKKTNSRFWSMHRAERRVVHPRRNSEPPVTTSTVLRSTENSAAG